MARGTFRSGLTALICLSLFALGCGGDDAEEDREAGRPFEPRASLTAIGGTARTEKPELVLRAEPRPGDASIRSAAVTLPTAFLADQAALGNVCSERELETNRCAGRQRMGSARVVSPAFGAPLAGPVYAVFGSGGLPRLGYVLRGPVELLLRGRIEVVGTRIKAGIEDVPATPLDSFELRIDGGAPGYLVLSRDICRAPASADASFTSHEGSTFERRIPLRADCKETPGV